MTQGSGAHHCCFYCCYTASYWGGPNVNTDLFSSSVNFPWLNWCTRFLGGWGYRDRVPSDRSLFFIKLKAVLGLSTGKQFTDTNSSHVSFSMPLLCTEKCTRPNLLSTYCVWCRMLYDGIWHYELCQIQWHVWGRKCHNVLGLCWRIFRNLFYMYSWFVIFPNAPFNS